MLGLPHHCCALGTGSGIWVPQCKITLGVTTVKAPGNLVCMVGIVVSQLKDNLYGWHCRIAEVDMILTSVEE